jgi:hypothetical protein
MIEKLAQSGKIRPVKFRAARRDGAITTVCGWQLTPVAPDAIDTETKIR